MKALKERKTLQSREPGLTRNGTPHAKSESTKRSGPSHSMYSTSTESSDQVQGAHNDLDRCARVLSEILDNDHGILDAIKKKARHAVSAARSAPGKAACKKRQGSTKKSSAGRPNVSRRCTSAAAARGSHGGRPVGGAWSSTPEKKRATAQPACDPAVHSQQLPPRAAAATSSLSDEDRENPSKQIATNMSALDSPTQRIRRMRNNEARRAVDELLQPPARAAVNRSSAAAAAAAAAALPPPSDDAAVLGIASQSPARQRPLNVGHGGNVSDSSYAVSEADTLRGVHLENSSQFGVPPVFSATAACSRFTRAGLVVADDAGPRSRPMAAAGMPVPARWESNDLHKSTGKSEAKCSWPPAPPPAAPAPAAALREQGRGSSATSAAPSAALAAEQAAAADMDPRGRATTAEPQKQCLLTRAWEPGGGNGSIPGADESGDATLVTSVLEAADGSPPIDKPLPMPTVSSALETCQFRLRYLVREIAAAAKSTDLRELSTDLEKAVDTLLLMSQPAAECREPSALLSENILLRNKVKLLETRLTNVKASADDHLELRCAAYQAQVSNMEALMAQLEKTILDERQLLQQAKSEISEQRKLISDLQSERSHMIHALAFKDECFSKLKLQCAAEEAEYTAWSRDLQLRTQNLESRLLGCSAELRDARLATERLASNSRAALDLLIKLSTYVDMVPVDNPWRISLQEHVTDIRHQLLRGCFEEYKPSATGALRAKGIDHCSSAEVTQLLPAVVSSPLKKSMDVSHPTQSVADLAMQRRRPASLAATTGRPSGLVVSSCGMPTPATLTAESRGSSQPADSSAAEALRKTTTEVPHALPHPQVTSITGSLTRSGRHLSHAALSSSDLCSQQLLLLPSRTATDPLPTVTTAVMQARATSVTAAPPAACTLPGLSSTHYSISEYFRKYRQLAPDGNTKGNAPPSTPTSGGRVAPAAVAAAAIATTGALPGGSSDEDVPRSPIRCATAAHVPTATAEDDARDRLLEGSMLCSELSLSGMASTDEEPTSSPIPSAATAAAADATVMENRHLSQYESFVGTVLDTSQSTIANDGESVVSTTTSVADSAFKQGLELLDANIARLQQQLQSSLRK